jgi:hypothetical protein
MICHLDQWSEMPDRGSRRPSGSGDRYATGGANGGDLRCENSGFWKSGRPLSSFVHHYSPRPHVVSC